MNLEQLLAVGVIGAMMVAFVWGRYRYDLVAAAALLAGIAVGVVPLDTAFVGFSDDIVIIVGSALLVSAGVARSGVMEVAIRRFAPNVTSVRGQLLLLTVLVAVLSSFVKNIGALAIMIPIAFQFARRSGTSPSVFLMPMAFASLLGGLMTLVGTSPNVVVARVRAELTGTSFGMFDFTPVGLALTVVGIVFLVLFHWLVPARTRTSASLHEAIDIKNYYAEARVVAESKISGKTIADLLGMTDGGAIVTSILRSQSLRITPLPDATLREGDIVLIEGNPEALDSLVKQAGLSVTGDRETTGKVGHAVEAIEAVIGERSVLEGRSAQHIALFDQFNVSLLAVSRKDQRFTERLGAITLRLGDVVVLQGDRQSMPQILQELGCLPLAERSIPLGSVRRGLVPVAILVLAMGSTAAGLVPVAIAFFAAAVAMILFGVLPLREVYTSIDWPILIMLAALIPVSDSLRSTGATEVMAAWLADFGAALPPYGALALILVAAMAVTPFLNNAATVLVMAPIAVSFAKDLGYRPEAFLMAVAIGAGCDFLTPIGHQCNTLVMGPGGYRFSDYPRLGLPLSLLVGVVAVPMLMLVWPLS